MFGKILFVFVAVLALQGISGNEYEDQLAANERGIIEEFQKVFEKLKNVVSSAVQAALDQLTAVWNEILSQAESIIGGVAGKFQEVVNKITNEITELKQKAEQLHIDITECLGENEEDLKAIPQSLLDKTRDCINKEVDKAKKIIEDTKAEIKKALNVVDEIWEEFKKCSGITALVCMGRVMAEASGKIISIPIGITKQVAATMKLMATAKINMAICESRNIAEATKEAFRLSGVITKCIHDKIEGGAQLA